MTSSFGNLIGTERDRIPELPVSNYASTEANMEEAVNKQIDRNIADQEKLFKELAMDKTMVGAEKTEYFKMLNQVLKNPDDIPEGIREIQQMLVIDPIGFKGGGLAEILEV